MIKSTVVSSLLVLTGLALAQPPESTTASNVGSSQAGRNSVFQTRSAQGFALPQASTIRGINNTSTNVSRVSNFFSSNLTGRMGPEETELMQGINQAASKIASKELSVQEAGMKELESGLDKLFDVRTSARESQIAELETRLKKLRGQLEERKSRKSEIVDLRLQTILNEANGLSF